MHVLLMARCLAVPLAAPSAAAAAEKGRELIPLFTESRDEPAFALEYTNDSDTTADLVALVGASTIALDDTVHRRMSLRFGGNMRLGPGQTWTTFASPVDYLAGAKRKGYDSFVRRWLWCVPLRPGRHRMTLTLGGKLYGPVAFVWRDSTAILNDR